MTLLQSFIMTKTPTQLRVQLPLSLKTVLKPSTFKVVEGLKHRTGIKRVLESWADEYLRFLHTRHLLEGGPVKPWKEFANRKKILAARKNKETRFNTSGSETILHDTGQLLDTTAPGGRGQIRRVDAAKQEIRVGISGSTVYLDPHRNAPARSRRTLGELAQQHSKQKRKIIVAPDKLTRDEMRKVAEDWVKSFSK